MASESRKSFLLRIEADTLDAMRRWADDDFRSLNSQIEYVLRRALMERGWLKVNDASSSPPAQVHKPDEE